MNEVIAGGMMSTSAALEHSFQKKREMFTGNQGTSHLETKERFSQKSTAETYPAEYRKESRKDQREKTAVLRTLEYLNSGCRVLDMPCGTGRLTRLLIENGFRVEAADVSPAMLERAKENYTVYSKEFSLSQSNHTPTFNLADIMNTGYRDNQFDAVICSRLFHHFTDSGTRVSALRELHRITSGTVIISFFNTHSFDACWRRVRNFMKRRTPTDRIPISLSQFRAELRHSGFYFITSVNVWSYISQMTYVVAAPVK